MIPTWESNGPSMRLRRWCRPRCGGTGLVGDRFHHRVVSVRVLVTGASGQVGLELGRVRWAADVERMLAARSALDITDFDQVVGAAGWRPDVIVNAAAVPQSTEPNRSPTWRWR